jgi:hypothetical protein
VVEAPLQGAIEHVLLYSARDGIPTLPTRPPSLGRETSIPNLWVVLQEKITYGKERLFPSIEREWHSRADKPLRRLYLLSSTLSTNVGSLLVSLKCLGASVKYTRGCAHLM